MRLSKRKQKEGDKKKKTNTYLLFLVGSPYSPQTSQDTYGFGVLLIYASTARPRNSRTVQSDKFFSPRRLTPPGPSAPRAATREQAAAGASTAPAFYAPRLAPFVRRPAGLLRDSHLPIAGGTASRLRGAGRQGGASLPVRRPRNFREDPVVGLSGLSKACLPVVATMWCLVLEAPLRLHVVLMVGPRCAHECAVLL